MTSLLPIIAAVGSPSLTVSFNVTSQSDGLILWAGQVLLTVGIYAPDAPADSVMKRFLYGFRVQTQIILESGWRVDVSRSSGVRVINRPMSC